MDKELVMITSKQTSTRANREATGSHGAIKTNVETSRKVQTTQRSTPDSGALDPVNKRSHLKVAKRDRLAEQSPG